ncbi:MAG TPA: DinB family protein [Chitinophagaceae bacterium]|nr:DinB family protein [Chitinophagaceae bacterium]
MYGEIKNYITEFQTIYQGQPFYGKPLMDIVKQADIKKVYKKPSATGHSAYEILQHLLAWRVYFVKKLNGDKEASIKVNSADDWPPLPAMQTEDNWKALIKKVELNHQALITALSQYKDESLDEKFAGSIYPLRTFLNGQIQHDIYHIGQIALAVKNN